MSQQHLTAISIDSASIQFSLEGTGCLGLIFVHGAWGNRAHWHAQIEYFSPKYATVAIDLAGHGDSSGGRRKAFTMQSFGFDVKTVVDQLGFDQVVLVGHSMGGAVILEAERLLSKRVLGLIGVDTFIYEPYQQVDEEQIKAAKHHYQEDYANNVYLLYRCNFHPETDADLPRESPGEQEKYHYT